MTCLHSALELGDVGGARAGSKAVVKLKRCNIESFRWCLHSALELGDVSGVLAEELDEDLLHAAPLRLRQYLYFCTSKASNMLHSTLLLRQYLYFFVLA